MSFILFFIYLTICLFIYGIIGVLIYKFIIKKKSNDIFDTLLNNAFDNDIYDKENDKNDKKIYTGF